MLIVVTSNDSKKNSMLLGKNKRVDFNCDTCQVRVLIVSCLCAVWKFSKKAGFVTQTLKESNGHVLYETSNLPIKFAPATFYVIELYVC